MKSLSKDIIVLIIFISCGYSVHAQEIGKMLSKTEANQKYGPAIQSFSVEDTVLTSLISQAGNYIMFNFKNENIIILGQNRTPLYPKGVKVSSGEVFKIYSCSKVTQLMDLGKGTSTSIENRGNVVSLTNGDYTLEEGKSCPPVCPK